MANLINIIILFYQIMIIGFEEVEEKSSHYGLYMLGFTCATRVNTKRCDNVELKQNFKNYRSSDYRLKLTYMKLESLVIVNQHVTVNDLSNFAHTAHHARRVVPAGHYFRYFNLI